jgi:hypothetical protein
MALSDRVIARYSTQFLANITNPQKSTGATYDNTKLQAACTDVQAEFTMIGLTYTDTTETHVAVAVEGVIALLRKRNGAIDGLQEWETWIGSRLERLRLVTSNDRILPSSSSKLTPSDENPSSSPTARPAFDSSHFDNIRPGEVEKSISDVILT